MITYLVIGSIVLLAIATIIQYSNRKELTRELSAFKSKRVLLLEIDDEEEQLTHLDEYSILRVNSELMDNTKGFPRRLMRKSGVQKLPCMFWLDKDGEIKYSFKDLDQYPS